MSLETSGLARSMEILQNTWAMSGTEVMINDFFFHKAKKKNNNNRNRALSGNAVA